MIELLLKELGFGTKEIQVYLSILKAGRILPAELAKKTGINRTTTYSTVKLLLKKGVIAEDLGSSPRALIALPPAELDNIVKKEERELKLKKAKVNSAIKELQKFSTAENYSLPKIVFIQEEDIENYLYKRAPIWTESLLQYDAVWWGFQDHTFVEHYQGWIDWYWKTAPKEISLQLHSNKSDIEEVMKEKKFDRRIISFWPFDQFTGTVWVNGDHLILIVTADRPFYLVEIADKRLAENFRTLFQGMWGQINKVSSLD